MKLVRFLYSDETNQLFVFFPEDEKVGVKPIKDRTKDESVSID